VCGLDIIVPLNQEKKFTETLLSSIMVLSLKCTVLSFKGPWLPRQNFTITRKDFLPTVSASFVFRTKNVIDDANVSNGRKRRDIVVDASTGEELTQEEWDKLPKFSSAKAEKRSIVKGYEELLIVIERNHPEKFAFL
jgi:hypothetical protein